MKKINKTPKISVVMPVYNTPERMLRPAIESILNQTYTDFEFLILNDGSTDKTAEQVIKSYKDPRIIYLPSDKNHGLIYQFNKGLKAAKGDYIVRMDADDISLPERFSKQLNYMEKNPKTGVLGSWAETFPEKKLWQPPENFGLIDLLKWSPWLIHPTIMLRASVLKKHDIRYGKYFSDQRAMAEDYDLWWQMILVSEIHNIPEVLLHYRYGEGQNTSVKRKEDAARQTNRIQQEIWDFLAPDAEAQKELKALLKIGPCKRFCLKMKYLMYKAIWILTGKGTFFQTKVEKAKKKLKGLR